jgi:5-formyltetrahydrofolate cyclo-ligase
VIGFGVISMKKKIQGEIKEKRKEHPKGEVETKSRKIMERLFEMSEFAAAETVLFYASKPDEVQTFEMMRKAMSLGKRVVLPITIREEKRLILSELKSVDDLVQGEFGVMEPPEQIEVLLNEIEVVIVPGIAFDEEGDRIGHGMGYYDKLLKHLPDATFIGLAFEFQIVEDIPEEDHDVNVHRIITEERVVTCQPVEL